MNTMRTFFPLCLLLAACTPEGEAETCNGSDDDGDGLVDESFLSYTWDADSSSWTRLLEPGVGQLTTESSSPDAYRTVVSSAYDDGNILRSETNTDQDGDGTVDIESVVTYRYEDGNPVEEVFSYSGADSELLVTTLRTYSGDLLLETLMETDQGANGNVDSSQYTVSTYDGENLVEQVIEIDNDGDGTADIVTTSTYTYDGDDVLEHVREQDTDGDGVADASETTTYSYGSSGLLEVRTEDADENADGTPEVRVTTTFAYDGDGNLENASSETDQLVDDSVDARTSITYAWEAGLLVASYEERDGDGDEVVDYVRDETWTHDDDGAVSLATVQTDVDGDGTWDVGFRSTYEAREGRLLGSTVENWDAKTESWVGSSDRSLLYDAALNLVGSTTTNEVASSSMVYRFHCER